MPFSTRRYRRASFAAALVGVLVLAAGSCGKGPFTERGEADEESTAIGQGVSGCGVERWPVKTGTDSDVGLVNMTPENTTIADLVSAPRPPILPRSNRAGAQEFQAYRLTDVTMTVYRLETDSDYHVVLSDGTRTMIAEIPAPNCVGAGSPFLPGIVDARATFDRSYTATTTFQTANVPATVVGVGFFDFLHGQRGVAPNGIELHAVLSICFGLGCGGAPADDFSLDISPASQSAPQGQTAVYTVSTALTSGNPQTVTFQATNLPSGVTAVFDPPSVTAGSSSQLTLYVSSSAVVGTTTFTVTGSGPSATHTAFADLQVTPAVIDTPLINGDFETGDLTGWENPTGFVRVTTTNPHTGFYSAQVGSRFPLVGDSVLNQVFTVPPTGTNILSFWFKPHCGDTIQYDWQDAEIRNLAGQQLMLLMHVCDPSEVWQQITADVTPYNGTTVNLVFTDHDDGYAGDPTWYWVDDVGLTTY